MRIERLRTETSGGAHRVVADVIWEDAARPSRQVFFEVPADGFEPLELRPEAFLVGAAVPALEHGERRILIDADVCPVVAANLRQALAKIASWFPDSAPAGVPEIECRSAAASQPASSEQPRHASFVSGGIDSLGVIAKNVAAYPPDAPERIQAGIFVHGFDIGGEETKPAQREFFDAYAERLGGVLAGVGVRLVPVATNIKLLEEDWDVWRYRFHGAALAAVAHALAPRFTHVAIAATHTQQTAVPWGSHFELDPLYSSAAVQIANADGDSRRTRRMEIVADWPEGLDIVRVCWGADSPPETPNCGRCEKCIGCMALLQTLGALSRSDAFPVKLMTRKHVTAAPVRSEEYASQIPSFIEFLRKNDQGDLADGFADALADYERWRPWKDAPPPPRWRSALRRLDDRLTGGAARAVLRRIIPARPPRD